jgi:hypothetical protein
MVVDLVGLGEWSAQYCCDFAHLDFFGNTLVEAPNAQRVYD